MPTCGQMSVARRAELTPYPQLPVAFAPPEAFLRRANDWATWTVGLFKEILWQQFGDACRNRKGHANRGRAAPLGLLLRRVFALERYCEPLPLQANCIRMN